MVKAIFCSVIIVASVGCGRHYPSAPITPDTGALWECDQTTPRFWDNGLNYFAIAEYENYYEFWSASEAYDANNDVVASDDQLQRVAYYKGRPFNSFKDGNGYWGINLTFLDVFWSPGDPSHLYLHSVRTGKVDCEKVYDQNPGVDSQY